MADSTRMTDELKLKHQPRRGRTTLLIALEGPADTGRAATHALEQIARSTGAREFAEIDPDRFYVFGREWPRMTLSAESARVRWPVTRFMEPPGPQQCILARGSQPQLRWRTFFQMVADLALSCGVRDIIHLTSLHAAVPHTRPVRPRGMATTPELADLLQVGYLAGSEVQSGANPALIEACAQRGMGYATLCAYIPQYMANTPNHNAARQLMQHLAGHIALDIDSTRVDRKARKTIEALNREMERDQDFLQAVRFLEHNPPPDMQPDTGAVVEDVEEFLKQTRGPEEEYK